MEEQNGKMEKAYRTKIPRGTYMPFFLAVSLLFLVWGLISYWIISIAGLIGFFIALAGWIKEIIYERTHD